MCRLLSTCRYFQQCAVFDIAIIIFVAFINDYIVIAAMMHAMLLRHVLNKHGKAVVMSQLGEKCECFIL